MRHARGIVVVTVAVVVLLVLVGVLYVLPQANVGSNAPPCGATGDPAVSLTNITADLPSSFADGSIQAFGSNGTGVIFGGISYYDRNHEPFDSLPALGSFTPSTSTTRDLTPQTAPFFEEGGVFPVGWNGSAWLIAGQTTIGHLTVGSAISLQDGQVTNLTSRVAPFFHNEGIWIAGWDGVGWLLGGNNTQGASLVYLEGNSVTNLTPLLPNNAPGDWIQALAWNGSGWLVGGQGVFGSYESGRFTNLMPQSPFTTGGVLAMAWNGSAWLVGGSPLGLAFVRGEIVTSGPSLDNRTPGWVNAIVAVSGGGWIVSGGTFSGNVHAPFLDTVATAPSVDRVIGETACLPTAFEGGWVQYGADAAAFGPNAVLLVGEGGTDPLTGGSHAAAALLGVGE
jgi:hypothetical protein